MDHITPRTIRLTERVATICRLAPDDVDYLLAAHRSHVEVTPTRRRHRYCLTPTGHVGTLVTPTCRLILRPKIPIENLFYLLDPSGPMSVFDDATTPTAGPEILDFLAARLAQLLTQRAAAGLHRAYMERATHGPFLQGRLDVPAQLRNPGGRKDRVHCRHEEFTADVPCNQVPRASAECVLRSPLLGETVRAQLRCALAPYSEVHAAPLDRESFRSAAPDRLTEAYRPLIDLCRLLADSLHPGETAGSVTGPAFLLNMERVFEQYVTGSIVRACPADGPYAVLVQRPYRVNPSLAEQPDLEMRPDLTIECDGRPLLVLDAKWKRLGRSPLVTEDVYQVLAYSTALGAKRAILVYPGRRSRIWKYPLEQAQLVVEVRTLRVLGSRAACVCSLQRMVTAVGAWWKTGSTP
jgi:5-methylcytosine-specific restriction enzyme subunit McrC